MPSSQRSVFRLKGFAESIGPLSDEIRELYLADSTPWVVGYSGGKDSSATLQLVWLAIRKLPSAERAKPIHVISTDTLVEQPVVARCVEMSLDRMSATCSARSPTRSCRVTRRSFPNGRRAARMTIWRRSTACSSCRRRHR